jgi:hypothetical protein
MSSISGADPIVKAQLDKVTDTAIEFACQSIAKHGEFAPFGMSMDASGEVTMLFFYEGETSDSKTLIELGLVALRERAQQDGTHAVVLVYEGRTRRPDGSIEHPDVIMIRVDHRKCPAVTFLAPYTVKKRLFRPVEITIADEILAQASDRIAFCEPQPES